MKLEVIVLGQGLFVCLFICLFVCFFLRERIVHLCTPPCENILISPNMFLAKCDK